MFNTLGSFSVVYFALAAVLFVLILFEKHFIKLEENIRAKKKAAKKSVNTSTYKKSTRNNTTKTNVRSDNSRAVVIRKAPNNAA